MILVTGGAGYIGPHAGRTYSVLEMACAFAAAGGREIPHRIELRRAGDIAEYWANSGLARRRLRIWRWPGKAKHIRGYDSLDRIGPIKPVRSPTFERWRCAGTRLPVIDVGWTPRGRIYRQAESSALHVW